MAQRGVKMFQFQSTDLLILIFAVLAIYGVWRYASSESNHYKQTRDGVLDNAAEIARLKSDTEKQRIDIKVYSEDFKKKISEVEHKLKLVNELAEKNMNQISAHELEISLLKSKGNNHKVLLKIYDEKTENQKKFNKIKKQLNTLSK